MDGEPHRPFAAGERVDRSRVEFDNLLAPGRYTLTPSVALSGAGAATCSTSASGSGVARRARARVDAAASSTSRTSCASRRRRRERRPHAAAAAPPGPSALGDDLRRFWHLTWTLAVTDFKLRFFGSVLGYLWPLCAR